MKADEVYVDPSALTCLYIHQASSRAMSAWRAKLGGTLLITHHGRTEVINAICRLAFIGYLDDTGLAEALADFSEDFVNGRLRQADILWRAALNRATDLSRKHTPRLGTRSLDVVHVACAQELKLPRFFTLDKRQCSLAKAVGLKLVRI